MKRTDIAYIAGIIDGEGSVCLHLTRVGKYFSYRIVLAVGSTDEWLPQWLKFTFGGSISFSPREASNQKPYWCWMVTANKALEVLKLVHPYLRLKRPQAEIAIKFQESRRGHSMTEAERAVSEAQRIVMAKLNQRGKIRKMEVN